MQEADRRNGCRAMLLLQGKCSNLTRDTAQDCELLNGERNITDGIAREVEVISRNFLSRGDTLQVDKISPFMHHILYHSRAIFTGIHQRTISYSAGEAANTIDQMMGALGERWKSAGKLCKNTASRLDE